MPFSGKFSISCQFRSTVNPEERMHISGKNNAENSMATVTFDRKIWPTLWVHQLETVEEQYVDVTVLGLCGKAFIVVGQQRWAKPSTAPKDIRLSSSSSGRGSTTARVGLWAMLGALWESRFKKGKHCCTTAAGSEEWEAEWNISPGTKVRAEEEPAQSRSSLKPRDLISSCSLVYVESSSAKISLVTGWRMKEKNGEWKLPNSLLDTDEDKAISFRNTITLIHIYIILYIILHIIADFCLSLPTASTSWSLKIRANN